MEERGEKGEDRDDKEKKIASEGRASHIPLCK